MHMRCDSLDVICFGINRSGSIVYIVDGILILSNKCLYNMLCLKLSSSVPNKFLMKVFLSNFFLMVYSVPLLGK